MLLPLLLGAGGGAYLSGAFGGGKQAPGAPGVSGSPAVPAAVTGAAGAAATRAARLEQLYNARAPSYAPSIFLGGQGRKSSEMAEILARLEQIQAQLNSVSSGQAVLAERNKAG